MQQVINTDVQIQKARKAIRVYRNWIRVQAGPLPNSRFLSEPRWCAAFLFSAMSYMIFAALNRSTSVVPVVGLLIICIPFFLDAYEEVRQRITVPFKTEQRLQEAKQWLLASEDKDTLPLLLDVFDVQSTDADVRQSLVRLLSRLEPNDVYLLNTPHRQHLYRLLQKPYSTNLALELAVVGALEHVGDAATPATLARLLRSRDTPPPLAQAAQRCLDALNARSAQQNQTQTLLRAALAPAPTAAHLLRPVQATMQEDAPELLLRVPGSDNVR